MSSTRIVFIIVCIVVAAIVFTIGFVMQRGSGADMSITSLLGRSREKRKKRRILPKTASAYFTIILALAAIALIIFFSRG